MRTESRSRANFFSWANFLNSVEEGKVWIPLRLETGYETRDLLSRFGLWTAFMAAKKQSCHEHFIPSKSRVKAHYVTAKTTGDQRTTLRIRRPIAVKNNKNNYISFPFQQSTKQSNSPDDRFVAHKKFQWKRGIWVQRNIKGVWYEGIESFGLHRWMIRDNIIHFCTKWLIQMYLSLYYLA